MSRLYQHFLTLVLLMALALYTTFLFIPQNLSHTSVDSQKSIDRMYISISPCLTCKLV